MITNGQRYSILILVANDLGLEPDYVYEAKKYLENGKISSVIILSFESEAMCCLEQINNMKLKKQAEIESKKYLT